MSLDTPLDGNSMVSSESIKLFIVLHNNIKVQYTYH